MYLILSVGLSAAALYHAQGCQWIIALLRVGQYRTREQNILILPSQSYNNIFVIHNLIIIQVRMCRQLLHKLAKKEEDDEVPGEKPKNWKSHCASILMQPVSLNNRTLLIIDEF